MSTTFMLYLVFTLFIAELLQNRAFQKTTELDPWQSLTEGISLRY